MTFQPNPVALRESRAMWRGPRSFLLLLCYAGALSLVAFLAYTSEVRDAAYWARHGSESQVLSARAGHTLFVALSVVQVVAWLLIAPALSATSISSERERGLLESLLMSQLKPRQIISGKFSVSASFVGVLIVATLPILAMCFLLGGVSPGEFGGAFAIQLATAFCALSLGVWLSTALRLSTHALGVTFSVLFVWTVLSFMAYTMPGTSSGMRWSDHAIRFLSLGHPLIGLSALIDPDAYLFRSFFLTSSQAWPLCIAFQVLVGAIFLTLASRQLARPLGEDEERESRRAARAQRRAGTGAGIGQAVANAAGTNVWGAPREEGHFDVPLLSLLAVGGPLLRHHLRAAWRWKKPRGRVVKWWVGGALMMLWCNIYGAGWAANYPNDAFGLLAMTVCGGAFASTVFVIGSSGLSIARDRELGMWNGLRLSSIRSPEIARAKMLAPLLAAMGYCVLLLSPLAAWTLCVIASHDMQPYRWRDLLTLPVCFPFWLLGTLQLGGWASLCSTRARRSTIALVAAFAGALIWIVGFPVVFEMSIGYTNYEARQAIGNWLALVHPIYALSVAADVPARWSNGYLNTHVHPLHVYAIALATHSAIALAFYRAVARAIAAREK